MSKAIFPGSFNPFTIGHLDILKRALSVFDEVVLAVGFNERKGCREQMEESVETLRSLFEGCRRVSVAVYGGLTVDAAREAGAKVIIRGFRNSADAEFERSLAATNLLISGGEIDTWLIPSLPELECISSSMVRELSHFGHPVDEFLPTAEECREACK